MVEHIPRAWLRRFVGYNSAVTNHINENPDAEKHVPIKKNPRMVALYVFGIKARTTQQLPENKNIEACKNVGIN
jgi:hypothetical protein